MVINRENYEAYFIDYLEGNLGEWLVNDFIEFLQNNPDLKKELSHFERVCLKPDEISFDKKDRLYKEKFDVEEEFNKAAVSNLEGELSETDKTELDTYLSKHPKKNRDIALFSRTKLQPDESILFKNKNKLYRRTFGRTVLSWSGRVAAILLLAFTLYLFLDRPATDVISENNVAMLEDKKVKKAETPAEINKVPVEPQKKETEKVNTVTTKPTIQKEQIKQKPKRSLRESTKGRLTHEDLVMNRIPDRVPAQLNSITASLEIQPTKAELADMYIIMPERVENYDDEQLLVDVVKEKTGLEKFPFNKITKAGLNLVSSISNDKFQYKTDQDGNVTEYKFDSKLLAFTIPSKNANPE